ncbi:MAG: hypothetical protein U0V74_08365 [Chitinophagales bacterium]
MKKSLPLLFCFICSLAYSKDYTGNTLLDVLGKSVYSQEFKQFSEFWLLDKKLENTLGGIKLYAGKTATIDTILIAGHDLNVNGTDYFICSSQLPFGVGLNDKTEDISSKLQATPLANANGLLFAGERYSVLLNNENGKIRWLKFFVSSKRTEAALTETPTVTATEKTEPFKQLQTNTAAVAYTENTVSKNAELKRSIEKSVFETSSASNAIAAKSTPSGNTTTTISRTVNTESGNKTRNEDVKRSVEKSVFETTAPVSAKTTTVTTTTVNVSTFKRAILDVFKSYKESAFSSIKGSDRGAGNFWNYKYTYSTKLKIPGEKFNMLYSFPFQTSALDFVSILHEGDSFDESFKTMYKDFEKKLMENFPASEGWTSSCIINKESASFSDLEFKNDKYGAVVLDYSKSPKGRHVLYLRFLLYN